MLGYSHTSVMVAEVLEALRVESGGMWIDGTAGGGGHAEAILRASSPTGYLFACDQDGDAVEAATRRLAPYAGRFELVRMNFAELPGRLDVGRYDGLVLDLGVSSHQIDVAERGFSFQGDGPLDMRMDRRAGLTAAVVVNTWPVEELARVFWEFGDERMSRPIARAIEAERVMRPFETTGQLAACVARVNRRGGSKIHPATRVFQALRIVVNGEWDVLKESLSGLLELLRPGGRMAVISFHSGEDRLVKIFEREMSRDYAVRGDMDIPAFRVPAAPRALRVNRRPIEPGEAEMGRNPRARSARLRVLEKV